MDFEKKTITKEDGRTLHYYHFSNTATESQTSAFREVDSTRVDGGQSVSGKNEDQKESEIPNV